MSKLVSAAEAIARIPDNATLATAGFVGMERSALHRKLKSLSIHADD